MPPVRKLAKRCTGVCGQILPRAAFFKCGKYLTGKCKTCYRTWMAEQEKLHPEWKLTAYQRQMEKWKKDPAKYQLRNLRGSLKRYNMTPEQYTALSKAQGDVCAICGRPNPVKDRLGRPKRLSIDHDHRTGEIRGLVCDPCNWALSRLDEIPQWTEKALAYLQKHAMKSQVVSETHDPAL